MNWTRLLWDLGSLGVDLVRSALGRSKLGPPPRKLDQELLDRAARDRLEKERRDDPHRGR